MQRAISLVCIRDGAILLLLKKDVWVLPGGKPYEKETRMFCLARQLREELPHAKAIIGEVYGYFEGTDLPDKIPVSTVVFFGELEGNLSPGAEVSDVKFFKKTELAQITISEITQQIINLLAEERKL